LHVGGSVVVGIMIGYFIFMSSKSSSNNHIIIVNDFIQRVIHAGYCKAN